MIAVAVRKLRSAYAFTMNSLPVITSVFADQNNASAIRYNIEFIVPDIVYHIGYPSVLVYDFHTSAFEIFCSVASGGTARCTSAETGTQPLFRKMNRFSSRVLVGKVHWKIIIVSSALQQLS